MLSSKVLLFFWLAKIVLKSRLGSSPWQPMASFRHDSHKVWCLLYVFSSMLSVLREVKPMWNLKKREKILFPLALEWQRCCEKWDFLQSVFLSLDWLCIWMVLARAFSCGNDCWDVFEVYDSFKEWWQMVKQLQHWVPSFGQLDRSAEQSWTRTLPV